MLPLLTSLKAAWVHREKIAWATVAALLVVIHMYHRETIRLHGLLAAKPKVETRTSETKVLGPERVVEKVIREPGGVEVVERVVYRDPVTITTNSEHAETPTGLSKPPKRWIIGGQADPFSRELRQVRGGVTFFDRLDLTYGYEFRGVGRHRIDLAWRF